MSKHSIFRLIGAEAYCSLGRHDPERFKRNPECWDFEKKTGHIDVLLADGYDIREIGDMLFEALDGRVAHDIEPLLNSSWSRNFHTLSLESLIMTWVVIFLIVLFVFILLKQSGAFRAILEHPIARIYC